MLIAVLAAGAGIWLYRGSLERDIADIKSRLVSEAELAQRGDAETASAIKLARSNASDYSTSAPTRWLTA